MTVAHPVGAPPVSDSRVRRVGQTRRGLIGHWAWTLLAFLLPLLLAERAVGLRASAWNQLWIVGLGVAAAALAFRGTNWGGRCRSVLTVTPEQLVYTDKGRTDALERSAVGLAVVSGGRSRVQWTLTVFNHSSEVVREWDPSWVGRDPEEVVAVLRSAGYPAGRSEEVYDGQFQSQIPGQPPPGGLACLGAAPTGRHPGPGRPGSDRRTWPGSGSSRHPSTGST